MCTMAIPWRSQSELLKRVEQTAEYLGDENMVLALMNDPQDLIKNKAKLLFQ